MSEEIKIRAIPQMDPQVCHFVLKEPIKNSGVFRFNSPQQARGSALAETLFALGCIQNILVMGTTIAVTKNTDQAWTAIGKEIGQAIRTALSSGETLISESCEAKSDQEKQLAQKAKDLIINQINPTLASHGGYIELIDVIENDVVIKMGGGCQGCAASKATLKDGVERSLKNELPEISKVIDATDHAAGANPYY